MAVFVIIVVTLLTIMFYYANILKVICDVKESIPNSHNDSVRRANVLLKRFDLYLCLYLTIHIFNILGFLRIKKKRKIYSFLM